MEKFPEKKNTISGSFLRGLLVIVLIGFAALPERADFTPKHQNIPLTAPKTDDTINIK